MYYIIYKTTNNINGMYYVGCHRTNNIDDGYLGSGKYLTRAISFYGKENFSREVLYSFSTSEEMFSKEREIVNEHLVKDPFSYNLKIGGSGGNPGIVGAFLGKKHTEETKEKQRQAALKQITTDEKRRKTSINNWARKDPERQREQARKNGKFPKSDIHKLNISKSLLGKKHDVTQCPNCNKFGGIRSMKRWHFDNCKFGSDA